jgi:hypothetical protein
MTHNAALERRYRRLLVSYPRAFREESGDEMLAVLLAGAGPGQSWPGPADTANLIVAGLWMRMRPSAPRSARGIRAAVTLMFAGAAMTAVSLALVIGSLPFSANRVVHLRLLGREMQPAIAVAAGTLGAACMIGLWLWMAWAVGHGRRWGRTASTVLLCLATLRLFSAAGVADRAFAALTWVIGFAAVWLLWLPSSRAHLHSRTREPV